MSNIDKKIQEFQNTSFKWCDLEDGNGRYIAGWQAQDFLRQALLDIQKETAREIVDYCYAVQSENINLATERYFGNYDVNGTLKQVYKQIVGEDYHE